MNSTGIVSVHFIVLVNVVFLVNLSRNVFCAASGKPTLHVKQYTCTEAQPTKDKVYITNSYPWKYYARAKKSLLNEIIISYSLS